MTRYDTIEIIGREGKVVDTLDSGLFRVRFYVNPPKEYHHPDEGSIDANVEEGVLTLMGRHSLAVIPRSGNHIQVPLIR